MNFSNQTIRTAAVNILLEHSKSGKNIPEILEKFYSDSAPPDNDKHLLAHIVMGIMRNLTLIDHVIHLFARKTKKLHLNILRIAVYQAICLERIPSYAVISETMNTAENFRLNLHEKKFLRAVLGTFYRQIEKFSKNSEYISSLPLSVKFSHPQWIINEWKSCMPKEALHECLTAGNLNPPVWIYPSDGNTKHLKNILLENSIEHEIHEKTKGFAVFNSGDTVRNWLKEGIVYSQGPCQYSAVSRCPASGRDIILEIGAAPGGKTVLLSRKTMPQGLVYAMDKNPFSMEKLHKRIKLFKMTNVIPVLQDFLNEPGTEFPENFDHIVLDAPCSNLGELCRRPEARWRLTPKDIAQLSKLQLNLVNRAWEKLKTGGTLLYITCTINKSENQTIRDAIRDKLKGILLEEQQFIPSIKVPAGGYFCLFKKT